MDFEVVGMVDKELSRAVVVYLRGKGLAWPSASPEAVAKELGAEAADRLMPRLRQLADEAVYWPVDWQNHIDDLGSATRVVEDEISAAHPELDQDAVRALGWQFSFCNKLPRCPAHAFLFGTSRLQSETSCAGSGWVAEGLPLEP
jgi:hypothetical protein